MILFSQEAVSVTVVLPCTDVRAHAQAQGRWTAIPLSAFKRCALFGQHKVRALPCVVRLSFILYMGARRANISLVSAPLHNIK